MTVTRLLAFDDSCARCSELSRAVMEASEGKIEVIPLTHPQAVEWRRKAFGTRPAPWAPTFLILRPNGTVRGYSGRFLAAHMVRYLGVRASVRVLKALGDLRQTQQEREIQSPRSNSISRSAFLRVVGGALTVAAVTSGFGSGTAQASAAQWVEQNAGPVPHTYAGVNSLAPEYRLAFFRTFAPEERRTYWLENLTAFRKVRPNASMTDRQTAVIARLEAFFRATPSFAAGVDPAAHESISLLRTDTEGSFSQDDARTLLLGTMDPQLAAASTACKCSSSSDYCPGDFSSCRYPSQFGGCIWLSYGCGTFYNYPCDGNCTG